MKSIRKTITQNATHTNDPVTLFLQGTPKELLTKQEEFELANIIHKYASEPRHPRRLKAIEKFVRHNKRYVITVAKKYLDRNCELQDLLQEGAIGLQIAVERFKPFKTVKTDTNSESMNFVNVRFTTYATWWIRQALTRYIYNHETLIRLPVHIQEKNCKIAKAIHQAKSCANNNNVVSYEQIADIAKTLKTPKTKQKIQDIKEAIDFKLLATKVTSLDQRISNKDGDMSLLGDFVQDENALNAIDIAIRDELKDRLNHALNSTCNDNEKQVLHMRYQGEMTLAQIGKQLNLSRERIRQIEAKALAKLREPKVKSQLIGLIN